MDEILKKMEALNAEIEAIEAQKAEADETEAKVYAKMLEGKTAKFDQLAEQAKNMEKIEARKKAMEEL